MLKRLRTKAVSVAIRGSLLVSPWPFVLMIRRQFAKGGEQLAATLMKDAPVDIVAMSDVRYAADRDALLDVYVPASAASAGRRLPTVIWTHGGAFVGGSKEEMGGYLRRIADAGFTVVSIRYTLAPEARYPTPVRQLLQALAFLRENADRYHVDPDRLVLAGDSAGAQISAQAAAIVTSDDYAKKMRITPTVEPEQLRGVVLCCGVFDLAMVDPSSPFRTLITAVGWAYSGRRKFREDEEFLASVSVFEHVTPSFPPAFLTVGNVDPLASQSVALAKRLESDNIDVETLFYPPDHQPALDHEYQFDLSTEEARTALDRIIAFVRRVSGGEHSPA